jgi:hypothetical protein
LTRTIVQGWLAVHNVVDVGGVIPVHVYAGSNVPSKVADPYPLFPDPYSFFPDPYPYPKKFVSVIRILRLRMPKLEEGMLNRLFV